MKKFEITEEQIKQAYDAACEDWKQRIKEWFPGAFKQQSGWYKTSGLPLYLAYHDFDNNRSYGFNLHGLWFFNNANDDHEPSDTLADEKEVEERLKEEAIRRGFKEGVEHNGGYNLGNTYTSNGDIFTFYKEINIFALDETCIFQNGRWAEIISTPPQTDDYITVNNIKYKRCN